MKKFIASRREAGFTLIEIVIVIAIAALILMAVLVFVPAVQKNQRDGSRRNNVGKVVSAVETAAADNQGTYTAGMAVDTAGLAKVNGIAATVNVLATQATCPSQTQDTYNVYIPSGTNTLLVCTKLENGNTYHN